MKKFLIGILAVIVIGFAGLQIAEHLVMGGDDYYVQITTDGQKEIVKADNGQEYINYKYIVTGYDEDGKEKQLEFTGQQDRPLRKSAYLKVTWNKKKGVTSYEEVKQSDIPKTAEKKLNKG